MVLWNDSARAVKTDIINLHIAFYFFMLYTYSIGFRSEPMSI